MSYRFLYVHSYLIWSLLADIAGAFVFTGILIAVIRRYILRSRRLDTKIEDALLISLLLIIILTGFIAEALRIAITGYPVFEVWSPVGFAIANIFRNINADDLKNIHYADWWVHMSASFIMIALLGSGKPGHVIISLINIYFTNFNNDSPATKFSVPVIDPRYFEEAESFGVSKVEEFTWKQLMDGNACTRCGRCQDNCPAYLTEKPLSPKKMINDVKNAMDDRIPQLKASEDRAACFFNPS